jgi:phosphatidate cytidylyltransferase
LVVILTGAAAWCLAAVCVFIYQKEGRFLPDGLPAGYVTGIVVLIPSWTGLVWLYAQLRGLHLTLLFFITVALMDSAAYIGGRRWGKTRLASRVSPGKTREGFYAGMVGALIPVVVFVVYERLSLLTSVCLVLLCLVCAGFSVVGDLFVSMFKRHANVKDSGKLLPGHGGVLDRVDGITAATPVFAAGIWMLEGRL